MLFFERGSELQARDRGLKELLASNAYGGATVTAARDRLRELVTQLLDRAKAAGVVRTDAAPLDAPVIFFMLGAVMDRSRETAPELWRRYLGLLLDGLRPAAATSLPVPPLTPDQLVEVMRKG